MLNARVISAALMIGSSVLTGCASIVNGNNQVLSVETRYNGQPVTGAACTLTNPKGTYYVTTPGTVTVNRAYDDMNVRCEKDGVQPGVVAVKSSTKAMAFGNIIFGGVIGAAVDAGTGAAYDYPTLISVLLGESITTPIGASRSSAQSQSISTDPNKVPYLGEKGQERFQTFLKKPLPRAFAISDTGYSVSVSGTQPQDPNDPTDPKERALKLCKQYANKDCHLYMVDNEVIFRR